MTKRLIASIELNIGDKVKWKKHPYDTSTYNVTQVFDNGNVFIDNGKLSYTDIKISALQKEN